MAPVPMALVLPLSCTVPFSTHIPPVNVLLFVNTTMLFSFTASPPLPLSAFSTPFKYSVFWLSPHTLIQLDFR